MMSKKILAIFSIWNTGQTVVQALQLIASAVPWASEWCFPCRNMAQRPFGHTSELLVIVKNHWWGVTDGSPVDSAWCGLHELTSEVLESHPGRMRLQDLRREFVQAAPCWIAKWSTIPNRPKRSLVVRSMNKATTLEQCRFLAGAGADRNKTRKVTRATLWCLQVTEAFWNLVICCWCYAADCESGGRFAGGFWVNASVKKWLWPVDQSKHPVSFSME